MTASTHPEPRDGHDLGWALAVLLRGYRETVAPNVGDIPHGARGYQVLWAVVRCDQPSQQALAHELGIDRTVMTYLIDDLVGAGLVERRPDPADRRRRRVVATPRGQQVVAGLCGQVAEAEAALLGALDDDERHQLRRLLTKAAGQA